MRALSLALAIAVFAPMAGAGAAEYTITISDMQFGRLPAELRAGDTIVWRNDDIFEHTATARNGSFDVDLPAKASATMVVAEPGSFEFFCKFHPGMTGTLVVAP